MEQCIAVVLFCFSLMICAGSSASQPVQWHYGVGSNIDDIWASKTEFFDMGSFFTLIRARETTVLHSKKIL